MSREAIWFLESSLTGNKYIISKGRLYYISRNKMKIPYRAYRMINRLKP